MKRLTISILCLVLVLLLGIGNVILLRNTTSDLAADLEQAEQLAESGSWQQAEHLTAACHHRWKALSRYYNVVLRRDETDRVTAGFAQVNEFLECRETPEYAAANALLISQLLHLWESEAVTLENLL